MSARATLIVLALVSPALAGPDDYPAGLFEHSPLHDTPAAVSRLRHSPPGQAKNPASERASGRLSPLPRLELSVAATMLTLNDRPPPPMSAMTDLRGVSEALLGVGRHRRHAHDDDLSAAQRGFQGLQAGVRYVTRRVRWIRCDGPLRADSGGWLCFGVQN